MIFSTKDVPYFDSDGVETESQGGRSSEFTVSEPEENQKRDVKKEISPPANVERATKKSRSRRQGARELSFITIPYHHATVEERSASMFPAALHAFFLSRGMYIPFVLDEILPPYQGRRFVEEVGEDQKLQYRIKSIRNIVYHCPENKKLHAIILLVDWEIPTYNEGQFHESFDEQRYVTWTSMNNISSLDVVFQYFMYRAPSITDLATGRRFAKNFFRLNEKIMTDREAYSVESNKHYLSATRYKDLREAKLILP
eukprot:759462-Hanusia_phi.AAC.1